MTKKCIPNYYCGNKPSFEKEKQHTKVEIVFIINYCYSRLILTTTNTLFKLMKMSCTRGFYGKLYAKIKKVISFKNNIIILNTIFDYIIID